MSHVSWIERPNLDNPIMVVAFEGWFDAGEAATNAVQWMIDHHDADQFAAIDADPYFNFQQTRPVVMFDDDGNRVIEWPDNECHATRDGTDKSDRPGSDRSGQKHDLVLLAGVEPHLRWSSFSRDLVELATETKSELVITLGSMVDMVPHTRPAMVKGSSTNRPLAQRLGLDRPTYQGPTGVIGVLHDALDRSGLPVISLRVGVPHYVSGAPNPKASMALLERFEQVTGVETGFAAMRSAVDEWEERVAAAVAGDDEIASYVQQVERELDRRNEASLPTGDDLAAEVERFLEERREDGPGE